MLLQKLAAENPSVPEYQSDLAMIHNSLGAAQIQTGSRQEGLVSYRQVIKIRKKLAAADPGSNQAQGDLSASYSRLGDALLQLGQTIRVGTPGEELQLITRVETNET